MSLARTAWQWHRWLAWIVGLQLLVWLSSGLVFAWLPFQPWVKGEDVLQRPALVLPAGGTGGAALAALPPGEVRAVSAVATPRGTAWRVALHGEAAPRLLPVDGSRWVAPDADAMRAFARGFYRGTAPVRAVERLERVPRRLGLVEETGGRVPVWRVSFDDRIGTRLYFDGDSGEFVALRNEAWVWYDFFWRLHIMDYTGGEDFNHPLLRAAATAGWLMAAAGAVLALLAAWRALRRRRSRSVTR